MLWHRRSNPRHGEPRGGGAAPGEGRRRRGLPPGDGAGTRHRQPAAAGSSACARARPAAAGWLARRQPAGGAGAVGGSAAGRSRRAQAGAGADARRHRARGGAPWWRLLRCRTAGRAVAAPRLVRGCESACESSLGLLSARARVRACACARMCVFACVLHVQELRPRCWLRTPALATLRPSMKLIYAVGWRPRHRPGQPERACGWYWDHNMASRAPTQRARVPLSLFHRAAARCAH